MTAATTSQNAFRTDCTWGPGPSPRGFHPPKSDLSTAQRSSSCVSRLMAEEHAGASGRARPALSRDRATAWGWCSRRGEQKAARRTPSLARGPSASNLDRPSAEHELLGAITAGCGLEQRGANASLELRAVSLKLARQHAEQHRAPICGFDERACLMLEQTLHTVFHPDARGIVQRGHVASVGKGDELVEVAHDVLALHQRAHATR
eukprot:1627294-Rhodomonas_salina.1